MLACLTVCVRDWAQQPMLAGPGYQGIAHWWMDKGLVGMIEYALYAISGAGLLSGDRDETERSRRRLSSSLLAYCHVSSGSCYNVLV